MPTSTRSPSFASTDWGVRYASCSKSSETLKKRGIALLSLEEKIDTSSAAGELVFHVFGAIAQFGVIVESVPKRTLRDFEEVGSWIA
jgi:Resolvase, N terminal domain